MTPQNNPVENEMQSEITYTEKGDKKLEGKLASFFEYKSKDNKPESDQKGEKKFKNKQKSVKKEDEKEKKKKEAKLTTKQEKKLKKIEKKKQKEELK